MKEIRYSDESLEETRQLLELSRIADESARALAEAIALIRSYPEIGAINIRKHNVRELILQRLPYRIVYQVNDNDILVLAVAHVRRRSRYWKSRLS